MLASPTVTAVTPAAGSLSGGTTVTITGTNFAGVTGVSFGSTPAASFTFVSPTVITAVSPAEAAGTVDVTVTTPANTSPVNQPADQFTFGVPTVTAVSPTAGLPAGGTLATITGTGFTTGATVSLGGVAATNVIFVSPTQLTAKSPAESAGTVDVTVTTPAGTSAPGAADKYTYEGRAHHHVDRSERRNYLGWHHGDHHRHQSRWHLTSVVWVESGYGASRSTEPEHRLRPRHLRGPER